MIHSTCEYLIYARNRGIDPNTVTFVPAQTFSPYMECLPTDINQMEIQNNLTIEVNPNFRYEDIFARILDVDNWEHLPRLQQFLFDFWIHEIFTVECLSGMTRQTFETGYLEYELLHGNLGWQYSKEWTLFNAKEQKQIMNQLMKLYATGDAVLLFGNALEAVYEDSYIYLLNQEQILIYIGAYENYSDKRKISFLQDMFLPMGAKVDIYWDRHFGILGIDETMILDEVELV